MKLSVRIGAAIEAKRSKWSTTDRHYAILFDTDLIYVWEVFRRKAHVGSAVRSGEKERKRDRDRSTQ